MVPTNRTRVEAGIPLRAVRWVAAVLLAAALLLLGLGIRGLSLRGALSVDARDVLSVVDTYQRAQDPDALAQEELSVLGTKSSLNRQERYALLLAINQLTAPQLDEAAVEAVRAAQNGRPLGTLLLEVNQDAGQLTAAQKDAVGALLAAESVTPEMADAMRKTRGMYNEQNYRVEALRLLDLLGVLHNTEQTGAMAQIASSPGWLRGALWLFMASLVLFWIFDRVTRAGRMFDVWNYTVLGVLALLMIAPLVYVLVGSFSSTGMKKGFNAFSLKAYTDIFATPTLARATGNSVLITVVGTLINIVITSMTAYVLGKKELPGRGAMLRLVMVFMLFQAGIIPDFIQVNSMGLLNTYWGVWLPVAISASNLLIMKNFFQQLPESIEESARIDGCNELQSFIRIVLPMSKASIATFSLFYAVGHWNNYFRAMIYLNQQQWPIQVWLRQLVILSLGGLGAENLTEQATLAAPDAMKYATIVVATVPIICVYPFLQKHFAKGMLVGSVKG